VTEPVLASGMPYADVLAANVRGARARAGLTQRQLSARMRALGFNWQNSLVAKLENGGRPLLATELLGLALALQTTISDLMAPRPADGLVQLPAGTAVPPDSVRRLAFGTTDLAVTWDGEELGP
jgi:transcriptional regulator with XRE-family HTH domain